MAYCLHITLRAQLKPLAPGLTSRAVLDKLANSRREYLAVVTVPGPMKAAATKHAGHLAAGLPLSKTRGRFTRVRSQDPR
jgi:hypothetical protein